MSKSLRRRIEQARSRAWLAGFRAGMSVAEHNVYDVRKKSDSLLWNLFHTSYYKIGFNAGANRIIGERNRAARAQRKAWRNGR